MILIQMLLLHIKTILGDHIYQGDISKLKKTDLPKKFEVLLAGFPCQGFSIANKNRDARDERNFLYKEVLKITKLGRPKIVVMENVKGILSLEKGKVIEMIVNDFKKIGYNFEYKLLNSADFGVPQIRERVVMIATRKNLNFKFPSTTHGKTKKTYVKVKNAIGYLSNLNISYNPQSLKNKKIYNHIASTNVHDKFWGRKYKVNQHEVCDYLKKWRGKSELSVKKIDEIFGYRHTAGHWFRKDNNSGSIPNPDDWKKLKKILKFDDEFDKRVLTLELKPIKFEQSLRINNWETPSDTITATSPEIHPNRKRRLSVRECAIIQTFPDKFEFEGSLCSMYRQIGNAVPVKMAEKIADSVNKAIKL